CAEITATLGEAPATRCGSWAYSYGHWVSVPLLIELARIGVAEQRAGPRQRIGLAVLVILVLRLGVLLRIIRIAIGGLVRAVARAELLLLLDILLIQLIRPRQAALRHRGRARWRNTRQRH